MGLKIITPVLAMMFMVGIFLVTAQPACAVSKNEIKVYNCIPFGSDEELYNELWIKRGEDLYLQASLHFDGGDPQLMKLLHLYVYNSKNVQIVNDERSTGLGGVATFKLNTKKWDSGTYTLGFVYLDESKYGRPTAGHDIVLHIV